MALVVGPAERLPDAQFASTTDLVEVYATVTDHRNAYVSDLSAADFVVQEDGIRQPISAFADGEAPLVLAIGIDRSFSVPRPTLRVFTAAARAAIDKLGPRDRSLVLAIGSEREIVAPLSENPERARDALAKVDSWGSTPLHDAIVDAMALVQSGRGRRALIVLTDGGDGDSQTTVAELVTQARVQDVLVYPVVVGHARPPALVELAAAAGGRAFLSVKPAEVTSVLETVVDELRHQYVLGYVPSRPSEAEPRWRSLTVRVTRPGLRVRARDGYWSR
jgi:Ca-activated chloride channel family protein